MMSFLGINTPAMWKTLLLSNFISCSVLMSPAQWWKTFNLFLMFCHVRGTDIVTQNDSHIGWVSGGLGVGWILWSRCGYDLLVDSDYVTTLAYLSFCMNFSIKNDRPLIEMGLPLCNGGAFLYLICVCDSQFLPDEWLTTWCDRESQTQYGQVIR